MTDENPIISMDDTIIELVLGEKITIAPDFDPEPLEAYNDRGQKYIREDVVDALLRQARNDALEKAATYAGWRAADCRRAYDMAREDETFVKFGCECRAKEALNIENAILAMMGEG